MTRGKAAIGGMQITTAHGRRKEGTKGKPLWILRKVVFLVLRWKKSNFTTFGHPLEKILPTPMPLHLLCKRVQQVHLALLT